MSYVDTFDHDFVGYFAGLPVYHPTCTVEGAEKAIDFACNPETLLIGGGCGEHPAIVVRRLDVAVATYLIHALPEEASPNAGEEESYPPRWNDVLAKTMSSASEEDTLHFAGWRVEDYAAFHERCNSPVNPTPLSEQEGFGVYTWICASIGEFVLHAMPALVEDLLSQLPGVREKATELQLENVLILPPQYPLRWGRKDVDGKLRWGSSIWCE